MAVIFLWKAEGWDGSCSISAEFVSSRQSRLCLAAGLSIKRIVGIHRENEKSDGCLCGTLI